MNQKIKTSVTSLIALVFLIVGTSGILLYFHLFETQVKELHELLGLLFVVVAIVHVYFNWKPMKRHMKNKQFWVYTVLVGITSILFISSAGSGENPKKMVIMAVLDAPLEHSLPLLKSDRMTFESKLQENGITIQNADSIGEIAKRNDRSPFELINLITK